MVETSFEFLPVTNKQEHLLRANVLKFYSRHFAFCYLFILFYWFDIYLFVVELIEPAGTCERFIYIREVFMPCQRMSGNNLILPPPTTFELLVDSLYARVLEYTKKWLLMWIQWVGEWYFMEKKSNVRSQSPNHKVKHTGVLLGMPISSLCLKDWIFSSFRWGVFLRSCWEVVGWIASSFLNSTACFPWRAEKATSLHLAAPSWEFAWISFPYVW